LGELLLEPATFLCVGGRRKPGLQLASLRLLGRAGVDEAVHTSSIAHRALDAGAPAWWINSAEGSPMVTLAVTC
jgi:hypothetical protein